MKSKWNLSIPQFEGLASRQAHADLPAGTFEREVGRDGFFGAASHVYHSRPPTGWDSVDGPIRPRAFDALALDHRARSPWEASELFHNAHVRVRFWRTSEPMDHIVRNADGDELLFVHEGGGDVYCDYGHITLEPGDYLLLPRGTMWRLDPLPNTDILLIESTGSAYSLPDRGPVGRFAPFDPGVLERPRLNEAFKSQPDTPTRVVVKRGNQFGQLKYQFNPLDALGWKGDLYPVRLNVRDIRPLMSHRVHLPPSVHTTFLSSRFIICTFVPKPPESDPGAMKLPFFHSNDDCDEVIFYHRGRIGSRGNSIGQGALTLHPGGTIHGPHPETLPYMFEVSPNRAPGYAVMVDTFDALSVGAGAQACEVTDYHESWRASIDFVSDKPNA
ncbi:MAG TPA: homogentisate 1,2-dioxygenase [Burkholderiaceae bacterium]|nr:homogentisate 1,2-dioxygenase [Burkholderiaceae bacterium]